MNCCFCKGKLKIGKIDHAIYIDNKKYTIENLPAKICSECGEYYVDTKTAKEIEEIIDLKYEK